MESIKVKNPYLLPIGPLEHAKKPLRMASIVGGTFLIGGTIWAALSRLDSAAHAPGKIIVDGHTQAIQHLEGGLVEAVHVKDGDRVKAGDPLIVLNSVHALTELNKQSLLRKQIEAGMERLRCEMNGFVKDPVFAADTSDDIVMSQRRLYETRRETYFGKKNLLEQQIATAKIETNGYRSQITSTQKQKELNLQVMNNRRKLVDQNILAPAAMLDQETKNVQYERDIDYLHTQIASMSKKSQELELQVLDLKNSTLERAGTEMKDLQTQLDQVAQSETAAKDVLHRTVLSAPFDGTVTNMRYTRPGSVVQHSEMMMQMVPLNQEKIIEARINPQDINGIKLGQDARVTLAPYKASELPTLLGKVTYVSPDTIIDHSTQQQQPPAYVIHITLPLSEEAKIPRSLPLAPGMPADVTVITGERSALRYILQPLLESFKHGLSER